MTETPFSGQLKTFPRFPSLVQYEKGSGERYMSSTWREEHVHIYHAAHDAKAELWATVKVVNNHNRKQCKCDNTEDECCQYCLPEVGIPILMSSLKTDVLERYKTIPTKEEIFLIEEALQKFHIAALTFDASLAARAFSRGIAEAELYMSGFYSKADFEQKRHNAYTAYEAYMAIVERVIADGAKGSRKKGGLLSAAFLGQASASASASAPSGAWAQGKPVSSAAPTAAKQSGVWAQGQRQGQHQQGQHQQGQHQQGQHQQGQHQQGQHQRQGQHQQGQHQRQGQHQQGQHQQGQHQRQGQHQQGQHQRQDQRQHPSTNTQTPTPAASKNSDGWETKTRRNR
jgi:hypothetical protein